MGGPHKTKTEQMMMVCLYQNGYSASEIGKVFGVVRETVLRVVRETAVPDQPVFVPVPKPPVLLDGEIPWPKAVECMGRR